MEYRELGRTGMRVSAIGFGAWAIGADWGAVDDEASMRALHAAVDAGVNFIDTADVYGDGRSERLVARLKRERPGDRIWVATKAGRRLPQQTCEGYSRANLAAWVERSLRNLEADALDLLQLHCPPSALYLQDEVFGILSFSSRAFLAMPSSSRSVCAPVLLPAKISWRPCSSYHLVSVAVMCIFSMMFRQPMPVL
jgi:aryl-alcohol dehydrogenase-like predicted oxidoreductase